MSVKSKKKRGLDKEIVRLAFPAIVSNITVPLLGLSDTAISGHLGAPEFIGAMSVGSMMLNVAFWLFGFLRMGTTGMTAETFGAGDSVRSRRLLLTSLSAGLFFGLVFILLRHPLADFLLDIMAPDSDVDSLSRDYFFICVFGAPALLGTMSVNGWFVGMQSTVRAMTVSISVNVVNIILSLWFVFGLDFGFTGVAYGTLCSQWFGLIVSLIIALPYLKRFSAETRGCEFRMKSDMVSDLKRFFGVNINLFFRSACVMAVSMAVTSVGSRLGNLTLATNAVMMQFFIFFSYFMDGFAFAGEALVGRSKGSRDNGLFRKAVKKLLIWSAVTGIFFCMVYSISAEEIVSLITDDPYVVENISVYRFWLSLIPLITVMAFIFDGFYIGLTRTGTMLCVTIIATACFFGICFIVPNITNNRLWFAFLTYLFLRGLLLAIVFPKHLPEHSHDSTDL